MFELFVTNNLRIVTFDSARMRLCDDGKDKKFLKNN